MSSVKRGHVNKRRSAGAFKAINSRVKAPNVHRQIMRGGWRL